MPISDHAVNYYKINRKEVGWEGWHWTWPERIKEGSTAPALGVIPSQSEKSAEWEKIAEEMKKGSTQGYCSKANLQRKKGMNHRENALKNTGKEVTLVFLAVMLFHV